VIFVGGVPEIVGAVLVAGGFDVGGFDVGGVFVEGDVVGVVVVDVLGVEFVAPPESPTLQPETESVVATEIAARRANRTWFFIRKYPEQDVVTCQIVAMGDCESGI